MKGADRDRWRNALTNGFVTVILSVVAGLGLWYGIVERRLAIVEDRSARNEETINAIRDDYVRRADIQRLETKLDALIMALTK